MKRGDREVGGWWAAVAVLFALAGISLLITAEAQHSFRLMQWSAVSWMSAFWLMTVAMPPTW